MLNQITIMGRLTKDVDLRQTKQEKSVASVTIACDRDYRQTGDPPETDFVNIVAWGKTAEFLDRNFCKGDLLTVIGRLQIRSYTDKEDNKRTIAEVVAERIYFCGAKRKQETKQNRNDEDYDEGLDGELPFN